MSLQHPTLVAAPGMTAVEIAAASTVKFSMPPRNGRGVIQPADPHHVEIRLQGHTIRTPPSNFTVVDLVDGVAHAVTATPQLDYLAVSETIALVKWIADAFSGAGWQPIETPILDALPAGLPGTSNVVLGEWRQGTWVAEMRVKQALDRGSDAAQIAGFPEGGYLTTLVVRDETSIALNGRL